LIPRSLRVLPHELFDPDGILLSDASVPTVEKYLERTKDDEEKSQFELNERTKENRRRSLTIEFDRDRVTSSTSDWTTEEGIDFSSRNESPVRSSLIDVEDDSVERTNKSIRIDDEERKESVEGVMFTECNLQR